MITLRDGPAKGTYMVKRAPLYLRAVMNKSGRTGGNDVLDQPDDEPAEAEAVHVYRRVGEAGHVHINTANRRARGFYAMATYEHLPEVDGEALRETGAWRNWVADCEAQL